MCVSPPAGSPFCLLASHRTWSSLQRCWSNQMFLPPLAHRLWRLTLQILARYAVFLREVRVGGWLISLTAGTNERPCCHKRLMWGRPPNFSSLYPSPFLGFLFTLACVAFRASLLTYSSLVFSESTNDSLLSLLTARIFVRYLQTKTEVIFLIQMIRNKNIHILVFNI